MTDSKVTCSDRFLYRKNLTDKDIEETFNMLGLDTIEKRHHYSQEQNIGYGQQEKIRWQLNVSSISKALENQNG